MLFLLFNLQYLLDHSRQNNTSYTYVACMSPGLLPYSSYVPTCFRHITSYVICLCVTSHLSTCLTGNLYYYNMQLRLVIAVVLRALYFVDSETCRRRNCTDPKKNIISYIGQVDEILRDLNKYSVGKK